METQIKSHFLIVDVMIRFRQEQLAVLENIEFTFYQVLASEENISFLRLLWWKDGDLNNMPIDYEMGRHVFGSVSPPSCSNYALKKTSDNNKVKYGPKAADTLNNKFYVDDMLRSVASVPEAITLVKTFRRICSAGGYRIPTF